MIGPTEQRNGVINAIAAYLMWGFAPLYFKLLSEVAASEVLVHRVIWSCVLLVAIVVSLDKTRALANALKQKEIIKKLTISALLLGCNWFLFIWAISNDQLLDASLGYYINPLFSVALGMIFLGERLRKKQQFAVALAIIGVLIQLVILGTLPIISLAIAGTFGLYGLLRKKLAIDSFVGLLLESLILLPAALIYWLGFIDSSSSNLLLNSWQLNSLLLAAGVVTTAPLLCFTAAAKRLNLSTLGFFQYIGPSIMFVMAVFLFDEPLQATKLVTFAFIWTALIIYSLDSLAAQKRRIN